MGARQVEKRQRPGNAQHSIAAAAYGARGLKRMLLQASKIAKMFTWNVAWLARG